MLSPYLRFMPCTRRSKPALPPKLDGDQAALSKVSVFPASMKGCSAVLAGLPATACGGAVGAGTGAAGPHAAPTSAAMHTRLKTPLVLDMSSSFASHRCGYKWLDRVGHIGRCTVREQH